MFTLRSRISLVGHCVICLKKVKTRKKGGQKISEDGGYNCDDGNEIAQESTVTAPGFLETFNDIWSVLKNSQKDNQVSRSNEGISLETVMMKGSKEKWDTSLETLTMCQLCCHKVEGVENLMKAVRQQVREISMLVRNARRVGGGRLFQFEKNLRDNCLEAEVIQSTLDFVRIQDSSVEKVSQEDGMETELTTVDSEDEASVECQDDDIENSHFAADADKEDDDVSKSLGSQVQGGNDDSDSDSDYIKSETEDDDERDEDDVVVISSDEEEEMPLENKVIRDDKTTDPLSNPAPVPTKRSRKANTSKSVVVLVQEGSSSKTVVCDLMEGGSIPDQGQGKALERKGRLYANQEQNCDMCGKTVWLSQLHKHLSAHVGSQFVLKCPNDMCPRLFTNPIGLRTHYKTYTACKEIAKEKKFGLTCDTCGFTTDRSGNVRKHLDSIHEDTCVDSEKKWKCLVTGCGKKFAVKQSVYLHLEMHRKIRKATRQNCDKCGDTFDVNDIEKHLKTGHGLNEVISCKNCDFKFSGRDEFVEHLFQHRIQGIICDICYGNGDGDIDKQVKYTKYVKFREHYFGEHGLCPRKFKCEEEGCQTLVWRKYDIKSHKIKYHKPSSSSQTEKAVFRCELCSEADKVVEFKHEDSLTSHKIRVHGAEPIKCEICGEGCSSKGKLYLHMKGHKGIARKMFECEVEGCGVVFKEKKSLKKHVDLVHNGMEKEVHVCDECGKRYSGGWALKMHRNRVHLGERLWVCEVCGEDFWNGNTLEVHRLIHTGERPFVCEICGQRFRHKEVLKRHLRGHEEKGKDFKPNGPMKGIRKRKAE